MISILPQSMFTYYMQNKSDEDVIQEMKTPDHVFESDLYKEIVLTGSMLGIDQHHSPRSIVLVENGKPNIGDIDPSVFGYLYREQSSGHILVPCSRVAWITRQLIFALAIQQSVSTVYVYKEDDNVGPSIASKLCTCLEDLTTFYLELMEKYPD